MSRSTLEPTTGRRSVSPRRLLRHVAVAEAITWTLLLIGMFLKYVTETTELGVRVFGMVHGIVFIAYCLTVVLVAVDQRWSPRLALAGLFAAVPPFATLLFEVLLERRRPVAHDWRLVTESPSRAVDRPVAWVLRHPGRGALVGLLAVAVLTGLALLVGPPVGG